MVNPESLFFYDVSSIVIMIVLAYLSKRLGDALKVKPYYKLLYVTSFLVICSSGLDIVSGTVTVSAATVISMALRFSAGAIALGVCLKYWNWLFAEFFKG